MLTNEQLQWIAATNTHIPAGELAAELLALRERMEINKQVTAEANKAWEGSQQLIASLTAENAALAAWKEKAVEVMREAVLLAGDTAMQIRNWVDRHETNIETMRDLIGGRDE
jgi:hypothetical protein